MRVWNHSCMLDLYFKAEINFPSSEFKELIQTKKKIEEKIIRTRLASLAAPLDYDMFGSLVETNANNLG